MARTCNAAKFFQIKIYSRLWLFGIVTVILCWLGKYSNWHSNSNDFSQYMVDSEAIAPRRSLATTSASSKGDFDNCRCDLTMNTCDPYWCWDDDWNSNIKLKWEKTDRACRYEASNEEISSASDWYDRSVVGDLSDLQFGLRIYTNNLQSFLWVIFKRGDDNQEFLDNDFGITTSTQFASEITHAEDDFSTPLEATTTSVPGSYSLGGDIYLSDNTEFKMPLPNTFGMCDEVRNVKFLENINSTRCSRVTLYSDCGTNLNAEQYTNITFNSLTGSNISVSIGNTWVVNTTNGIDTTTLTSFATTAASGTTDCTCTNVLKEIHYTAIISYSSTNGYELNSVTADIVYMNIDGTCTDTVRFDQIYSFTFKENSFSRLQSASPGYLKGYPVPIGNLGTTNANFIDANEGGFQLYGVDNDGNCLIDTTDPINPNALYYSNPTINYADDIMYGWKLSYTAATLVSSCTGTTLNIAFIENLIDNLRYVGIYGNSNPHFSSDWVEVEVSSTASAEAGTRTCTFDNAYSLVFYVTKFGTEDNPQLKISRARLNVNRLVWTHDLPLSTDSKDFHVLLSISFQEVPQGTNEFVPTPPNRLPKLSRNVLYPFFTFDDAWTTTASITILCLFMLFFVIE